MRRKEGTRPWLCCCCSCRRKDAPASTRCHEEEGWLKTTPWWWCCCFSSRWRGPCCCTTPRSITINYNILVLSGRQGDVVTKGRAATAALVRNDPTRRNGAARNNLLAGAVDVLTRSSPHPTGRKVPRRRP